MKKDEKQSRKLTLNRETVRNLNEDQLLQVAGGLTTQIRTDASCANSCDPVSVRICPTSRRIC